MIKLTLKTVLAAAVYYSGVLSLAARSGKRRGSAIILMYHRVLPRVSGTTSAKGWERFRSLPGIVVSPEFFEAQLLLLKRSYNILSLHELLASLDGHSRMPERAVVVTFDDGWRDNFEYAFPILKKHSVPATIFLTADYVDSSKVFWPEQLIGLLTEEPFGARGSGSTGSPELPSPFRQLVESVLSVPPDQRIGRIDRLVESLKRLEPFERDEVLDTLRTWARRGDASPERVMLNWDEIMAMKAAGINFESHGLRHELFTVIGKDELERELRDSKHQLEARLGTKVSALAYPNGDHNEEVKQQTAKAGYSCAVSVRREHVTASSDRYSLGRINVHDGSCRSIVGGFSRARFACHIQGFPR